MMQMGSGGDLTFTILNQRNMHVRLWMLHSCLLCVCVDLEQV